MPELEKIFLERLRSLCSKSEKCRKDISEKLNHWKYEGDHKKILETLTDEGFLDEQRYAQSFVNDKIRFGKWGKIKIQYLLRKKGIRANYIELAMEKISDEEYAEMVENEIVKKVKAIKSTSQIDKKKKLYSFAVQRGYESDLALKLIQKIIRE